MHRCTIPLFTAMLDVAEDPDVSVVDAVEVLQMQLLGSDLSFVS